MADHKHLRKIHRIKSSLEWSKTFCIVYSIFSRGLRDSMTRYVCRSPLAFCNYDRTRLITHGPHLGELAHENKWYEIYTSNRATVMKFLPYKTLGARTLWIKFHLVSQTFYSYVPVRLMWTIC